MDETLNEIQSKTVPVIVTVRYGGTIEEIIVTPQNEEKDENTNM